MLFVVVVVLLITAVFLFLNTFLWFVLIKGGDMKNTLPKNLGVLKPILAEKKMTEEVRFIQSLEKKPKVNLGTVSAEMLENCKQVAIAEYQKKLDDALLPNARFFQNLIQEKEKYDSVREARKKTLATLFIFSGVLLSSYVGIEFSTPHKPKKVGFQSAAQVENQNRLNPIK